MDNDMYAQMGNIGQCLSSEQIRKYTRIYNYVFTISLRSFKYQSIALGTRAIFTDIYFSKHICLCWFRLLLASFH